MVENLQSHLNGLYMPVRLLRFAAEDLEYRFACWRHVQTSQDYLRVVLVNGSPKSGTTWMLRLISSVPGYQPATGLRDANFLLQTERYLEVQPGEVIHGHDPYTEELDGLLRSHEIKVVLVLRDPRDQAVSRAFHIRRSPYHPWRERLAGMSDDEALLACIEGRAARGSGALPGTKEMISLAQSWRDAGDLYMCVKYEDLVADTVAAFHRVLQFILISMDERLVETIVERNRFERYTVGRKIWKTPRKSGEQDSQSFYRKGIVGDWKNHFKKEHIRRFKEIAGEALIELGYETDTDW